MTGTDDDKGMNILVSGRTVRVYSGGDSEKDVLVKTTLPMKYMAYVRTGAGDGANITMWIGAPRNQDLVVRGDYLYVGQDFGKHLMDIDPDAIPFLRVLI